MSDILLSIITVSYNTKEITLNCLRSILKHTKDLKYEIIVVDNGSRDDSVHAIEEYASRHSEITLITAKENLGFGKANNLGAQSAKGRYLLFLNSDTLIFDNALKISVDNLVKRPKVGVYSCCLLNADKSIQPSGGYFPTLDRLIAWQLFLDDLPVIGSWFKSIHPHQQDFSFIDRLIKRKKNNFSQKELLNTSLDWVTGAFMIVPKKIFDNVHGFDPNIFMYTEELELCYRVSKLGYTTLYQSYPAVIHLGGASGSSFLALTSEIQNMIYFWKKHKPSWHLPLVKFVFFTGSLLRLLIFGIIKGDEKARRAYTHALKLTI